ncbi:arsenate reductase (azurin) small subunit [Oceanicella actignis]|uniref:Arsenite oxidase small subunit n=1 Tax=Oceanicella actignis TaxID=1189325 RepID=A0A1M7T836_9RHOB|nr:arsenate reductase (azurin) small subunit [Oceanicella actignis]TYO89065.1 arsenite oxidase small subunit [Oceanicella actignis]SET48942.1 arsenite oxidase small subunit [Oceanicella actignis]SHN66856.1 arsenite oxidase small subunit [Oceanicella actignis]
MKCKRLVDVGRRQFLRGSIVGATGAAAATVLPAKQAQARSLARIDYPSNRLANIADLAVNEPMDIAYPDPDSPGVLLKLGQPVEGGVGPDGDIVAFSVLCPHKGWPMTYNAEDKTLNCPGHHSRFDCEAGGQQIWGHATQNLPQFLLRVDDKGDIYAEGVDELIYGRLSNVLES